MTKLIKALVVLLFMGAVWSSELRSQESPVVISDFMVSIFFDGMDEGPNEFIIECRISEPGKLSTILFTVTDVNNRKVEKTVNVLALEEGVYVYFNNNPKDRLPVEDNMVSFLFSIDSEMTAVLFDAQGYDKDGLLTNKVEFKW